MKLKKYISRKNIFGSFLAVVGYILSPMTWWNDLFVNIPLAYLMGSFLGIFFPSQFSMLVVLSYWLTNVLGIVMMHKGIIKVTSDADREYTKHDLVMDLVWTSLYSILIAVLVISGILKLPTEYFPHA